jgi:hypothetical protein
LPNGRFNHEHLGTETDLAGLWSVVHTATLVRDGDGFHLEDERWT